MDWLTIRQCDGDTPRCSRCLANHLDCTWQLPVGKRGPRRRQLPEHAPSPTDVSPSDSALSASSVNAPGLLEIWRNLLPGLSHLPGHEDTEAFFSSCIDAYMRYLFPITPLVHEASMQGLLAELFHNGLDLSDTGLQAITMSENARAIGNGALSSERSLNLLLAVCAQVCALIPNHHLPSGDLARTELFSASEQMLRLYQDRDLEQPCAASVIIRYFHASCFHAAGNIRVSWLVLGEAIRIAMEMQMFDESSLFNLNPLETQFRRAIFWQLSTGDKSSSILNSRPLSFQRLNFESSPSTLLIQEILLRDPLRSCNGAAYERGLSYGFALISTLFDAVTDILTGLKYLRHTTAANTSTPQLSEGLRRVIGGDLLRFQSALDDLPIWLDRPWQWTADLSEADLEYQRLGFWIQHVNLKLTYHAMKLILLQKASDMGLADVLGFSSDVVLVALQKTEIANEMVLCMRRAPFDAIRLNGESCVRSRP